MSTSASDTGKPDEGDRSGRMVSHGSERSKARPRRRRRAKAWRTAQKFIDALLLEPVDVVVGGERRRVKAIQAIVLQLLRNQGRSDRRAQSLLLKYQTLAQEPASEPRIVVKGGLPVPEFWNPDANRYE